MSVFPREPTERVTKSPHPLPSSSRQPCLLRHIMRLLYSLGQPVVNDTGVLLDNSGVQHGRVGFACRPRNWGVGGWEGEGRSQIGRVGEES